MADQPFPHSPDDVAPRVVGPYQAFKDRLSVTLGGNLGLVAVLIVAGLAGLAWSNRFVQDDAFISFRYASNLASGEGLVWNRGYRVEGYTNFLWTLLMAIPHRFQRDPVALSFLLGLASFVVSLGLTYKLAALALPSKPMALLTLLLLGTNYTFSCYATGGLETQFQASLFLGAVYLLTRSIAAKTWSDSTGCALSVLAIVSVLTRPDSLILAAIAISAALALVCLELPLSPWRKLVSASVLIVPFAAALSTYGSWKLQYFGSLLPNSYYVKLGTSVSYAHGLRYVYAFLASYWLLPFPVALLWFSKALVRKTNRLLLVPLVLTLIWSAYVVHASGDFMEYRLFVPVMPFFFLLVTWLIVSVTRRAELQIGLVALLALASWRHAATFVRTDDVDGIEFLESHLTPEGANWIGIGKVLGSAFVHDPDVTIAVTAAGAIPYHSGLRTIDMLGINDLWIARHGRILSARPGHQRIATLDYLIESGTHLIIGHPFLVPPGFSQRQGTDPFRILSRLSSPVSSLDEFPDDAQFLEIPIDPDRHLLVVYLTRDPGIDALIRRNGWRTEPLRPGSP